MMNPLSSRRYTELVDRINGSFSLFTKYLSLKIKLMKKEIEEMETTDRLTLEQTKEIIQDFADDLLKTEGEK